MTLTPLSLDTLSWEDLRQLGQQQAPVASGGRWTHHSPVDPGITLLELFAFLIDQQIFVMDQLSPDMQLAILALLGDAPRGAGVARTLVAPPEGTLAAPAACPAGTVLVPQAGGPAGLAFSLAQDVLFLPVDLLTVTIQGDDRTVDLRQGRAQPIFASAPGDLPDLAIAVRLSAPLDPALIGQEVALAVILDDGGAVPPEWHPDAHPAPPPVELALRLDDGAGGWLPPLAGWHDGTGGMRRSGLIRFALPAGWAGRSEFALALSGGAQRLHAEPPRLAALAFGAGLAHHAVPLRIEDAPNGDPLHDALRAALVDQLVGWLPLSGCELALPHGLIPALETGLALVLQDRTGAWHQWQRHDSLIALDGEARSFTYDRELGLLRFGDGYAGRVPAPAQNLRLDVQLGGGVLGNHPAGLVWRARDSGAPGELVSLAPAVGGAEAETPLAARQRLGSALGQVTRAVTADDHVVLAETSPGIARHRAAVAPGHDPAFPCAWSSDSITVFVVPVTGEDAPAPTADPGALAQIRSVLGTARLLTTRVFVEPVVLRPADVRIEIEGLPALDLALGSRLRSLLSRYLHPALGGAEGTGWPFGHPLRPSELMRVIEAGLPHGARVTAVAIRLMDDPGSPANACGDTAIGPYELPWLAAFDVAARAAAPVGDVL